MPPAEWGEETNKLAGYVAAVPRHLDAPLAVPIQSSSAAGKISLMDSILAFVPEEQRVEYSAMTGQSQFYRCDTNLKNKVLAIAEEEGVSRAAYALKLPQSEGALTMASTGKDGATGRLVTRQYRVEGPVMIFLTTTAIHLDEELLNRCLVLTVDEDREQTRAIHRLQRERLTAVHIPGRLPRFRLRWQCGVTVLALLRVSPPRSGRCFPPAADHVRCAQVGRPVCAYSSCATNSGFAVCLPSHRRRAAWRKWWSSASALPVAVPVRRSADLVRLPAHGVSRAPAAAVRLSAAVLPSLAAARANAHSQLPDCCLRSERLSPSFTIKLHHYTRIVQAIRSEEAVEVRKIKGGEQLRFLSQPSNRPNHWPASYRKQ